MDSNYYLGLDIGTSSVGWAVTTPELNVIKRHGKALWGVRLFDEAQTAEDRRSHRTARRLISRSKERTELLQDIFAEEISKVDPGFYLRMKESKYWPEDKLDAEGKTPTLPYALFADENYTDKDFHKQFKTIFHLRKELIESRKVHDIRLVYLAVHHIIKHRGHFLFEGKDFSKITEFETAFSAFVDLINTELFPDEPFCFNDSEVGEIKEILCDKKIGRSTKKQKLAKLFTTDSKDKDKQRKELAALISGCSVKLEVLFDDDALKDAEKNKVCFAEADFEENITKYENALVDRFAILQTAKAVYDWVVLADVLGQYQFLSEAKAALYDKHASDLKRLKKVLKPYPKQYKMMFAEAQKDSANYSNYIGLSKKNGRKQDTNKKCSREDFYKFIKAILKNIDETEDVKAILNDIETESFMPKQMTKDNSVIPYQVHKAELEKILENASEYLPFLNEKDSEGYTAAEKIMSLLTFRIPYYVGPINTYHSDKGGNSWAVRRDEGKVYPWNFSEKIDEEASAEKFIRRMTNKCTYLVGKDVLPKESLLYSKFTVLNELNNLRLDDTPVSVALKQEIFNDLFLSKQKVTQKALEKYLKQRGIKFSTISGIDGDFKSSMKAYLDFKGLTNNGLNEMQKEQIILFITLFSESPAMLRKIIARQFPELSAGMVRQLADKKYSGWGRLSREFLEEIYGESRSETGEAMNIITCLWETNENLMQLLGNRHGFAAAIEAANAELTGAAGSVVGYKDIAEMYISPSVKRPVWQTIQIVKEIQKIMGSAPSRIFVEVTRENTDSGRTVSRKNALQELYKNCLEEEGKLVEALEAKTDNDLRGDRLFLYFAQKGRCMYSGEPIELEDLYNKNLYDIDHIYPQSKVMDDSLTNRVLVKRTLNETKSDVYPLPAEWRKKMTAFWDQLLKQNFISKEKYYRLTRSSSFDAGELSDFVARQMVETNQSNKAVAQLLEWAYPDSKIIYSKAKVVSQFRQDFELLKVRDMNDLHHAKDAYLNIVCGNAYYVKFTSNPRQFMYDNPGRSYNLNRFFEFDVKRGDDVAWLADGTSIATVKRWMSKNNILVTRKEHEASGGFYKQNALKKGKGQIPVKGEARLQDINKYGGYDSATIAYFILVESDGKKGQRRRTINHVPLYLAKQLETSDDAMQEYCENNLGLRNPKIIIKKILKDSLFIYDGAFLYLSSKTDSRLVFNNANQLILNIDDQVTLKKAIKFNQRLKQNKNAVLTEKDKLSNEDLCALYQSYVSKMKLSPYAVFSENDLDKLERGFAVFQNLSRENKCTAIANILPFFQCNSGLAAYPLLGEKNQNYVRFTYNSNTMQLILVHQSITGFYEKRISLNEA